MVGIVLVSENNEGREILKTTRRLLGNTHGMTSVCLKPGMPIRRMKSTLEKAMRRVHSRGGLLLVTDLCGSTQCTLCHRYLKKGAVELVTGFNLPMVLKLGLMRGRTPLGELIPFILSYGKEQMYHFSRARKGGSLSS